MYELSTFSKSIYIFFYIYTFIEMKEYNTLPTLILLKKLKKI